MYCVTHCTLQCYFDKQACDEEVRKIVEWAECICWRKAERDSTVVQGWEHGAEEGSMSLPSSWQGGVEHLELIRLCPQTCCPAAGTAALP